MIVEAAASAPPHMFLRGFRAPAGGAQYVPADDLVTHEEVGTLVARVRQNFDNSEAVAGDVATEDLPYPGAPTEGPFRFESDIPIFKPEPDVVVVDTLVDDGAVFGSVEIDRGAGFGAPLARNFGWLPRGDSPGRRDLAGLEGAAGIAHQLTDFDGALYKLPDGFDNAFLNGGPIAGQNGFAPGDRLRFTDTTGPVVVTVTTVPAAPALAVTMDGASLDPPLTLTPLVDTVVMDRAAQQFLFVWRVTVPWEARFVAATLEVS